MVYRKRFNGRLRRRWYVNAAVGRNVPFIGGTGVSFGSGKSKRSLDSHIKQVVRKSVLEPKVTHSGDITSPTLLHNTIYSYNILKDITVGTSDYQREGDYINIKNVNYSLQFYGDSSGSTDMIKLRVMVIKSKVANSTAGVISAHVGSGDIFYSGSSELMTSIHNPSECGVLHDRTLEIKPSFSGQKLSKLYKFSVNLPKIHYEDGTPFGRFANYYLVFIPYIDRGSVGSTTVGDLVFNSVIKFTDGK